MKFMYFCEVIFHYFKLVKILKWYYLVIVKFLDSPVKELHFSLNLPKVLSRRSAYLWMSFQAPADD